MTQYPRVGIVVLILNDKKEVLLGYRLKSPASNIWAPPGGKLEFGESFEECAIREVKEETNLTITNPKFLSVASKVWTDPPHHSVFIHMAVKYAGNEPVINMEPTKAREWKWFDLNDLPESTVPAFLKSKDDETFKKLMAIL